MSTTLHAPTRNRGWIRILLRVVTVVAVVVAVWMITAEPALACTSSEPTNCLPMYRWRSEANYIWQSDVFLSWFQRLIPGAGIGAIFSGLLFGIGSLGWGVLSWVIRTATEGVSNASFTESMLDAVNNGFSALMKGIMPLVVLVLIMALMMLIPKLARRGASASFFQIFMRSLIPLGVVLGMAAIVGPTPTPGVYPKGSPAWLAKTGIRAMDYPVNAIVEGLHNATLGITGNTTTAVLRRAGKPPTDGTCTAYIAGLHDRYVRYSKATNSYSPITQVMAGSWESSHLNAWYTSQFGSMAVGDSVGCRLLEVNRVTPADEQLLVGGIGSTGAYIVAGDSDEVRFYKLMSWLHCTGGPGGGESYMMKAYKAGGGGGEMSCSEWLAGGAGDASAEAPPTDDSNDPRRRDSNDPRRRGRDWDEDSQNPQQQKVDNMPGHFGNGKPDAYERAYAAALNNATTAAERRAINDEYQALTFLTAGWGGVVVNAIVGGLAAIVNMVGMAVLIGMPAFGVVVSQFIMAWLLMALPLTLVLMAFPGGNGEGSRLGKMMFNITIFSIFSKGIFTVLMALNVLFLSVTAGMIDTLVG